MKILVTFFMAISLSVFSMSSFAQNRIEGKVSPTTIIINGKMTYEVKNKKYDRLDRLIDLTREDLRQTDSIEIYSDTLIITSFLLSSGDCGIDSHWGSQSNKVSGGMKNLISKDCCKNIWIENIKAEGKSGKIYTIKSLRVNLITQ